MNERVFLAFRGLAILIHCFPGLGPSERHTPCVLCLLVDQKLALRWTDISREKALFLYSEITADLPILGDYSTVQDTSLWLTRR